MENELISIIIPTFNRGAMLPETLDSVLAQTHTNWECIVVDDASTDNTAYIMSRYTDDARFKYYHRPINRPKGANACRNFGFERSSGAYINWFDSDDIMHPEFLEARLAILKRDPELQCCACTAEEFEGQQEPIVRRPPFFEISDYATDLLLRGFYIYTPAPLWRREFLNGKLLFDEELHRGQEADFHFRMLSYQPKFKYLDQVLFKVRTGHASVSFSAALSVKAQLSVFRYFDKVFKSLVRENKDHQVLLRYIFYRQASIYYDINRMSDKKDRRGLRQSLGERITYYIDMIDIPLRSRLKIRIGLWLLQYFDKGYSLFYFPEYDARQ